MSIKLLAILGSAILFVGCQSSASFQTPLNNHDYGPSPLIIEADIKELVGMNLKDEESARYKFGDPQESFCNSGLLSGGKVVWTGWVLPFQVNAKNSYGAFVGYENRFARYEGNKLLDVSRSGPSGPFDFTPSLGTGCKLVR